MSEGLSFLGQVDLEKVELISHSGSAVNILTLVQDFTLYEDIFSTTLSGYILVQDAIDLVSTLPMIGQEMLTFQFSTPSIQTKVSKTMYIYKMQILSVKPRSQTYMLHFCSQELIMSANSKISKAYSGKISDTVVDIFRDKKYLNSSSTLYVEETKNSYSFIPAYGTPIETINWLTHKSMNVNGTPNYIFFESNQSFEYVSVEKLMTLPTVRDYIFADVDPNTVTGYDGDKDKQYSIVQELSPTTSFDYLKNLNSGMFASRLHTIDLTTKNINVTTYDYLSNFGKTKHLDGYPMRTDTLARKKAASVYFIEKNNYQTGSFKQQGYSNFFLQRNSLLEQLNSFKLNITVPGRCDIKVGNTIHLTMPKLKQLVSDEVDKPSEYYTGKYLITAIRHQIIGGKHSMKMEIISDSFVKPLVK